jgi:hypothetical protein
VSIDFAYAQARAQARLGERLSETGWRVLESTLGLPQYLASVRNTSLAPLVQHFSTAVSVHAVERALRDEWRAEVAAVSRWVPEPWSSAVAWSAWLAYLDALAWLMREERALAWMQADTVLATVALNDAAARQAAIANAPFGALAKDDSREDLRARWYQHWAALCPRTDAEENAGLALLVAGVRRYLGADERQDKRRDARTRLDTLATGLVHRRAEEPAAIFSYLALVALDLQRLRDGILRRALFRDEPREEAA